ncbi:MAG: transporter substrate-binding domain-containing protein [Gammaproteobacteria bacterium]|nr:transporter substrate-binding domain-containing protein [Gammaproteobacteria bacterium]
MRKLSYALFLILALGLIYLGLQTNTPPDSTAPESADLAVAQTGAGEAGASAVPFVTHTETTAAEEAEQELIETLALLAVPHFRDFDEMVSARVVRALVVYSKTSYFLDGVVQRGLSYDALREFESFINKKLNIGVLKINVIFLPVTRDQLLPALQKGLGDIAVANLTITPERRQQVDFSTPSMRNVSEMLVTSAASGLQPGNLDELAGMEIHVRESSSYYQSLSELNEALHQKNLRPVNLVLVDENLEDEDLLEMVNADLMPAIVVDSHKATFWRQIFENIRLHEHIQLRSGAEIGWAFRQDSPELKAVVDEFMRGNRAGTLRGNVLLKRYLKNTRYVRNSLQSHEMERFNDTVHLFRKYASEYDFDWLMVVAQAYQESRLDQGARSHTGAVGIMQLLPSTAADKNVNIQNIEDIENNIHAGIKYLHFIRKRYFEEEEMSEVNKTLFAFAAYNAGPARVAKLRREARQRNLDPDIWFENVEIIAARRIGRETVQYVSNIYKYWIAYQLSLDKISSSVELSSRL